MTRDEIRVHETRTVQKEKEASVSLTTLCMKSGMYRVFVGQVSGSGLNLQALLWAVQQMLERLSKTEQEVNELQTQQLQEDMRFYRKYHDRLLKVLTTLTFNMGKVLSTVEQTEN